MNRNQIVYNTFIKNKTTQQKHETILAISHKNKSMNDGGFGSVTKMLLNNNGKSIEYVIKKVANVNKTNKYKYSKHQEYDYLRIMDHPNIIKVYDVFDYKSNAQKNIADVLYIVSEFGGKTLDKHIQNTMPSPYEKSHIFMKICSAIAYISNLGLIHRDLKVNNITINNYGEPKIIDYGLMIFKTNDDNGVGTSGWTRGYYLGYALVGFNKYRRRTDNFALGVLLWYIFTKKMPKSNFYETLQERDWLQKYKESLETDEYLNTNKKKEKYKVIINLVIDLIEAQQEIFDIENLKTFYMEFNSGDRAYNRYKLLSIPPSEKVTEIIELRDKMVNATTKIQTAIRVKRNKKIVANKRTNKVAANKEAANKVAANKVAANKEADFLLINRFVNRSRKNTHNYKDKLNPELPCQDPDCDTTFGFMTRRIHCKICLNVFCKSHAKEYEVKILQGNKRDNLVKKVICDQCFAKYTDMKIITTDLHAPSIGGKRAIIKSTKKVRKHQGIYQRGPKKGILKPGFKYSGKKTKTGLKIIIKTQL